MEAGEAWDILREGGLAPPRGTAASSSAASPGPAAEFVPHRHLSRRGAGQAAWPNARRSRAQ
eukprot:6027969-Prorocentrum_lima.AAC.1